MKWTGTLRAPRIEFQKYRQVLQQTMLEHLSLTILAWLQETAETIPVWSGASKATFLHVARAISFDLSISPVVASRIPLGESEGSGELQIDAFKGSFRFIYKTSLAHLVYNEYNNANQVGFHLRNPGPYNFQSRGEAAFLKAAKSAKLPAPLLKINRIKVG